MESNHSSIYKSLQSPRSSVGIMIERVDEMVVNVLHNVIKLLWQNDILAIYGMVEQWCNFIHREFGNATAYFRHQKLVLWMLLGKQDEFIHVWLDSLNTTLHGWDGIALTLKPNAQTPYRSKAIIGKLCCTTAMCSGKVTTKDEYLVRFQLPDKIGRKPLFPSFFL